MDTETIHNHVYPAEMGDKHLSELISELDKKVDRGMRDLSNELKDLRNELRDNVSKETFQSEIRRVDENRSNDVRYNEAKFGEIVNVIEAVSKSTHSAIDGIKSFTWKIVTLAVTLVGAVFTVVNVFL